jgi:DNA polymerase-1
MPQTVYLIDGHALAYRTYYALTGAGAGTSRWVTTAGEPTAGIFGFTSVLLRLLEQERPDYMAVAFDRGRTFRDDLYPAYKGTREKMPDDLRPQIDRIRELVDAFGIPRLEVDGYEADDVLGSVAKKIALDGMGVKIITGDKDLLQLVDKRIIVSLPGKQLADSKDYLPHDVFDFLGVRPEQVVDYKAMIGDKSDNIPGIAGIGEKTAATLLEKYKTLEGIYQHLDELKPAQKQKFQDGKANGELSQKLSRIVTDLDIEFDVQKARTNDFNPGAVEEMFRQLEFRSLMKRLYTVIELLGVQHETSKGAQLGLFPVEGESLLPEPGIGVEPVIVDTPRSLADLADKLGNAEQISFDLETTSTSHMRSEIVGISISIEPGKGYYIPIGHSPNLGRQLPLPEIIQALRPSFTDPKIPKVGHNLSFDFVVLVRHGLVTTPLGFDSMIAEWVGDSSSRNLGLKGLVWTRLSQQMIEIEDLLGKGRKQITMAQVPIGRAGTYAVADAEVVLRLKPILEKRILEEKADRLFNEIEMPLVPVLASMEMKGISLDTDFLHEMAQELDRDLSHIAQQVYQQVGEEFNLNSPQQLSHALFDRLKVPPPDGMRRKTSSGAMSTAADILEALRDVHPVVNWILDYRELSKLKSTYVDALPLEVNPQTGRVHTSYNQSGTVTGRIASSEPNLQNIPIRTELGRKVRRAFIASPGNVLLGVDYSQVELRIVAHIANDEALLQAFRDGQDIHATTAASILGIPLAQVTNEQRRNAKAVNFGLIYGMSPFGLSRGTDLTLAEAENFVKAYFTQFPGVRAYIDNTKEFAKKYGYVETLLGRRRYFPGLKDGTNYILRSRMERECINSPIQGTAADIMKVAMLKVAAALPKAGLKGQMLLQVHDELVLEIPEGELDRSAKIVSDEMSSAYQLKVPLQTEVKVGKNWGQMQVIEV